MLSPDKKTILPHPFTEGTEHALLRSPDTRLLDNKNVEFNKDCVATGIIVTPTATGKKPAAVISSIETFNSRLWNKNRIEIVEWILVISAMDWEHSIIIMW